MFQFNTVLCHAPGEYAARVSSLLSGLLSGFDGDGVVDGYAALKWSLPLLAWMMSLPVLFYWQYRSRRWRVLGGGLTLFILLLDYLMLKDRGDVSQTFAGAAILYGFFYLPLALGMECNLRLSRAIGGKETVAPMSLQSSQCLMLVALAVSAHLFFFVTANALDIPNDDVLKELSSFINCLFYLPQPVNLSAYRDMLNMVCATLPTVLLVTLLNAWLCKRRQRGHAFPWPLYFAALPGVAYGGLLLVALMLR